MKASLRARSSALIFVGALLLVALAGVAQPHDPGLYCGCWCDYNSWDGWYCECFGPIPDDYCCWNYTPGSCGEAQTCEECSDFALGGEGSF